MDLDVMHKQVAGLQLFKKRVEDFLANAGVDLVAEAGDQALSTRMTALEEGVAGIQKAIDDHNAGMAVEQEKHDAFQSRLEGLLTWFDEKKAGLETLLSIGDDFAADTAGTTAAGATDAASAGSGTADANASTDPAAPQTAPQPDQPAKPLEGAQG